jgi:hypothetical protein
LQTLQPSASKAASGALKPSLSGGPPLSALSVTNIGDDKTRQRSDRSGSGGALLTVLSPGSRPQIKSAAKHPLLLQQLPITTTATAITARATTYADDYSADLDDAASGATSFTSPKRVKLNHAGTGGAAPFTSTSNGFAGVGVVTCLPPTATTSGARTVSYGNDYTADFESADVLKNATTAVAAAVASAAAAEAAKYVVAAVALPTAARAASPTFRSFGTVDAQTDPRTLLQLIAVLQHRNAELTASNQQLQETVAAGNAAAYGQFNGFMHAHQHISFLGG